MASPFFQKINVQKSDFSPIARAGEAWKDAFESAGEAIGEVGSAYFKRKKYQKDAANFIKSDSGKDFLKMNGWSQAEVDSMDQKEAEKIAFEAIREAGGVNEVEEKLFRFQQRKMAQKKQQQDNYLFQQQKAKVEGENSFFKKLGGSIKNKVFTELEGQLKTKTDELNYLFEQPENEEGKRQQGVLIDSIAKIKKEMDSTAQTIPMTDLKSDEFAANYGRPENPYEARAMNSYLIQKKELESKSSSLLAEQYKTRDLIQKEAADVVVQNFVPDGMVAFDEGERNQMAAEYARNSEVQLTEQQQKQMADRIQLAPTKEIIASKQQFLKNNNFDEHDSVMQSAQQIEELLSVKEDGKFSGLQNISAVEKYARIIQPVGLLTESDIQRAGGTKDLKSRFSRALQELKDGTLDDKSRKDLLEASQVFARYHANEKKGAVARGVKYISDSYQIDPRLI